MCSDELRSDDLIVRRYECGVRVCRESLHVMRAKCDIRRGECTHILTPIHTTPADRSPLPPFSSLLIPSAYPPPDTHTASFILLSLLFSFHANTCLQTQNYRLISSLHLIYLSAYTHTHIRQTPGSSCGCRRERQGHVGLPGLCVYGGTIRRGLHRLAT